MTPQHHTGSAIPQFSQNSPPPALIRHKGAPICPSTDLKVFTHFVYIQYGCGKQSMGIWSLNHDTKTSYRLGHTPVSLKFTPTCTSIMAIRVYPYAHPQHLKVLKHFVYIHCGCGMHSIGVCSLNHDFTTSYRLGHTPLFLKFTPPCTCITA